MGIGDDGLSGRLLRLEEDDAGDAGGTGDFDESAQIGLKLHTWG